MLLSEWVPLCFGKFKYTLADGNLLECRDLCGSHPAKVLEPLTAHTCFLCVCVCLCATISCSKQAGQVANLCDTTRREQSTTRKETSKPNRIDYTHICSALLSIAIS
jgi:hypothetical protein